MEMLLLCDGGGSNRARRLVFKEQLERVADRIDMIDPRRPLSAGLLEVQSDRTSNVSARDRANFKGCS